VDVRSASPLGWARYASGGSFKSPPHVLLLNRVLMAAAAGEKWASRVIIQMPPRHGKSEFCSGYFPSWYLGMYPDRKLILASYGDEFAAEWGMRNRDQLEAYGPDVFNIRVRQDTRSRSAWAIVKRRGRMYTAGVGGTLTGRGAHFAIIDDPVKNDAQAMSEVFREKAKTWYRATLRSRMETADAPIVVIQTRWHTDDLAGWLQEEFPGEWLVISLPAIAEDDEEIWLPDDLTAPAWTRAKGEPLWAQKYDLEALEKLRKDQGGPEGYWWLSLYQQRPTPLGGGVLKPADFRTYELVEGGYLLDTPAGPLLIASSTLGRFGTMDLAASEKKMADFTVVGAFGLAPPNLLVLDILRGHWAGPDLARVAGRILHTHKLAYLGVESVGLGLSIVQDMQRGNPLEAPPRLPLPVKGIPPQGDKVTRALTLAARMGSGHVYVNKRAPWYAPLVAEMATFPKGVHDDMVDVMAYAALEQVGFGDDILRTG
jgi:predicted phage terminase large subunit-like protein